MINAHINGTHYKDGWRSVNLQVAEPAEKQAYDARDWCITSARLLRPRRNAVLARAKDDDYSSKVFYPENPVREIGGRVEGKPQRFALEFFIHFTLDDDRGARAKFKVTYSHINKRRSRTGRVCSAVPADAQTADPLTPIFCYVRVLRAPLTS